MAVYVNSNRNFLGLPSFSKFLLFTIFIISFVILQDGLAHSHGSNPSGAIGSSKISKEYAINLIKDIVHKTYDIDIKDDCAEFNTKINEQFKDLAEVEAKKYNDVMIEVLSWDDNLFCNKKSEESDEYWKNWLYGILSVTAITLLSIAGIFIVPPLQRIPIIKNYVMVILIGAAIGALLAQSLIHLIPEAVISKDEGVVREWFHQISHSKETDNHHEHNENHKHHGHSHEFSDFFKPPTLHLLLVLLGVFVFYVTDHVASLFSLGCKHDNDHCHDHGHGQDLTPQKEESNRKRDCHHHLHPKDEPYSVSTRHCVSEAVVQKSAVTINVDDVKNQDESSEEKRRTLLSRSPITPVNENAFDIDGHEKHSHSHNKRKFFDLRGVLPIAWLILIGDALHNFMDGLAIGISFGQSHRSGLVSSFAIFLHELPHEIGDYAILIASGLSKWRAVAFNIASQISAYIGLFIGLLLQKTFNSDRVRQGGLAFTAGGFIYIALADLMPVFIKMDLKNVTLEDQLASNGEHQHQKRNYKLFAVKFLSFLCGIVFMTALIMVLPEH